MLYHLAKIKLLLLVLLEALLLLNSPSTVHGRLVGGNSAGATAAGEHRQKEEVRNDEDSSSSSSLKNDQKHEEMFRRLAEIHLGNDDNDGHTPPISRELTDTDEVNVIVGYKNSAGKVSLEQKMKHHNVNLKTIPAEAITIQVSELKQLLDDPNIAYVDVDDKIKGSASGDIVPYGIEQSQNGPNTAQAKERRGFASSSGGGACSNRNALKVAILDSGVDGSHDDLPCSQRGSNCEGRDFTGGSGGNWNSPTNKHGTNTFGVIAALSSNNVGVMGMVHNPNVCYLIAKVLDGDAAGSMSNILEGVEWALGKGAKVFNLSIDGARYSNSANQVFDEVYRNGGLVVAAAGNDGIEKYNYPAAYESVISVAAVGEERDLAYFSQRNNRVDLAATGMNILSTTLMRGSGSDDNVVAAITAGGDQTIGGSFAQKSNIPARAITGKLVDCPEGKNKEPCPGNGGHICIMERGKAAGKLASRCKLGGGEGIIIYNDRVDQKYNIKAVGGKSDIDDMAIVGISKTAGREFIRKHIGETVSIEEQVGYTFSDGTSVAAPHVTGAIAELWSSCPDCNNRSVEQCLQSTAMNLGSATSYGNGLIQTEDAYFCLQNREDCC